MVEHPFIYEINTWVWLDELSRRARSCRSTSPACPASEWDAIAELGFDAVWLMGVWERSPAGIAIALENEGLVESFRRALPDFATADVVGSPYCIRDYAVDAHLGGPAGLAAARAALAERGLGLILDFVPNHVAPDHPWTRRAPGVLRRAAARTTSTRDPASFVRVGGRRARERPRPLLPGLARRRAAERVLARPARRRGRDAATSIAAQCDGVRCDMAMLMMNDIFERTWGERAGPRPADDYWPTRDPGRQERAIPASSSSPRPTGTSSGRSSSRASTTATTSASTTGSSHDGAEEVRGHLTADLGLPAAARPLHREPRRAARGGDVPAASKARAAAVATLTQTGARLVHEGQLEGRARAAAGLPRAAGPTSRPTSSCSAFYERLLGRARATASSATATGSSASAAAGTGNDTWQNLVAWGWRGESRRLVVVNLGDAPASGHVSLPWDDLRGRTWRLDDAAERRGATSAAATTSATASTSPSTRGPGTSST